MNIIQKNELNKTDLERSVIKYRKIFRIINFTLWITNAVACLLLFYSLRGSGVYNTLTVVCACLLFLNVTNNDLYWWLIRKIIEAEDALDKFSKEI